MPINMPPDTENGPRRRRTTLRDVAEAAQVDLSTASRLLRDQTNGYRAETVDRVRRAAKDLNYRVNTQARGLVLRRQQAIAMLIPDLDNFGFTGVLRGIQDICSARHHTLLLVEVREKLPSGSDPLGLEGRVDGVLVASTTVDDPLVTQWLGSTAMPTVLVQRGMPGAEASVVLDEEANATLMVDHLAGLGHRRIAHISGSLRTDTAIRRQAGFNAAMTGHGLPLKEEWTADSAYTFEGGAAAATKIMSLPVSRRPTAVAVDNLVSALGTLNALRDLSLHVPTDVSVITIDEHVMAQQTTPPLTTIKVPQRELGHRAAEMLLDVIDGGAGENVIIRTPPSLIVRGSTARPPGRRR
jgi:LacI family transcriptional regulator